MKETFKRTDKMVEDVFGYMAELFEPKKKPHREEKDYYCEVCELELDGDELEWFNDTPVCPECQTRIEY